MSRPFFILIIMALLGGFSPCYGAIAHKAYVCDYFAHSVYVVDTQTHTTIATISIPGSSEAGPWNVTVTPDGKVAYVTDQVNHQVHLIDTQSDTLMEGDNLPITVGLLPDSIAFTSDGTKAYVTDKYADKVYIIDTADYSLLEISPSVYTITVRANPTAIAMVKPTTGQCEGGEYAYVAHYGNNTVAIIDTATYEVVATPPVGYDTACVKNIAITPDGKYAYVTNFGDNAVAVIETGDINVFTPDDLMSVGRPMGIAITPDGTHAYVVCQDPPSLLVVDIRDQANTATRIELPNMVNPNNIIIDPKGTFAYVDCLSDETIALIDIVNNEQTAQFLLSQNFNYAGGMAFVIDYEIARGIYDIHRLKPIESEAVEEARSRLVSAGL